MIPYGRQDITDQDIEAVAAVLRSDFLTQGEKVPEFEAGLCQYTGAGFAVAANSATSCLHLACMALGVGSEDTVWCPSITFVASANCARYCGASIEFCDVEYDTANIDIAKLSRQLVAAERAGTLPKALVVVHMGGNPCDMQQVAELARRYCFAVIEDASHAVGARYHDGPVGNCRYSDITIFSFHPVKIVTTAEGGAALTNNAGLAEKMSLLRSHGVTREPTLMSHPADGPWYYQQIALGYNYRMTDLHAALGISQLQRLDDYVARRNAIATIYQDAFSDLPLVSMRQLSHTRCAWHLYIILLDEKFAHQGRLRVFEALRSSGIAVNVHYIPVHTQPYYCNSSDFEPDLQGADSYYSRAISLPMFPALSAVDQAHVIEQVRVALSDHG